MMMIMKLKQCIIENGPMVVNDIEIIQIVQGIKGVMQTNVNSAFIH